MKPVSIRIITADIKRLTRFFETVTGITANWLTEDFSELRSEGFTIALGSTATLKFFGAGVAQAGHNKAVIIEFLVRDVDQEYEKVKTANAEIVQEPTTMPWGNRSLLFRDPDGNLINFFTPVTAAAKKKFG
ncbi:MAG: VOC family protein [Chitinophagaceae bacterium]|nr:MAG: VOC family protein [Chitinophagaceae bacterium]